MEKNYLFIKSNDSSYNLKNMGYTDIHFWNLCEIENKELFQNVYFYCKSIHEVQYALEHNCIAHITFMGDDIFSPFYSDTSHYDLERFWFPEKKHLTDSFIDQFLALPEIDQTPIAVVYNPFFQSNITYEEFFSFIKKLNSKYVNPLFLKDLSLHNEEKFSLSNRAIIDGQQYYVVLGLFGDYYSLEIPCAKSIHFGILKDTQCVTCDLAQSCKERGLGILKFNHNIKSCVGIKLFNQD